MLAVNLQVALATMPLSPVLWVGQPGTPVTLPGRTQLRRLGLVAAAVVALPLAFQAASNWLPVQLWLHRGSFGRLDPILGYDIGFYIFTLPLIDDLTTWLLVLLALSAAASIAIYILGGRMGVTPRAGLFVAPGPRQHLAILAAVAFLVLAVDTWFTPARQLLAPSGLIFGASLHRCGGPHPGRPRPVRRRAAVRRARAGGCPPIARPDGGRHRALRASPRSAPV